MFSSTLLIFLFIINFIGCNKVNIASLEGNVKKEIFWHIIMLTVIIFAFIVGKNS